MIRFIAKRAIRSLISLYVFLTFVFFFSQLLIPGDFTNQFIITRSAREAVQRELGLDRPLWQRYVEWLQRLVTGDLGTSFGGYAVIDHLKSVLPSTLLIFLTGTIIAFLLGQWLGRVTAWRGDGLFSGATTFGAIALYTSFPPWLAFLVVYFFVRRLELFPQLFLFYDNPFGEVLRRQAEEATLAPETVINYMLISLLVVCLILLIANRVLGRFTKRQMSTRGFVILAPALIVGSWYAFGFGGQALGIMHLASLPMVTYILLSTGETLLIMQTTMKDTLNEEYVRAARAKGLPEHVVRDKHAARNAIIPVFSRLVVSLPYLLTGIVIIERSVNWPGMGTSLFSALYNQDMPVVMGSLLVIGVLSMVARLALEVIQLFIDPRLRDRAVRLGDFRLEGL